MSFISRKHPYNLVLSLLLIVSVLFSFSGCVPLFEIEKGLTFSDQDEIKSAQEIARKFEESKTLEGKLYTDPFLEEYIISVGQKIAFLAKDERPVVPSYSFKVVDDHRLNAFTFGGGFIYVTTGILANIESEAQLAFILSHEVAHVSKAHVKEGIRTRAATVGALNIAYIATFFLVPGLARFGELVQLFYIHTALAAVNGHGRGMEREADMAGLNYAYQSGYDPREAPRTFELFLKTYGDPPPLEQFFYANHPSNKKRLETTKIEIESKYKDSLSGKELVVNPDGYLWRTWKVVMDVATLNYEAGRYGTAKALFEKALKAEPESHVAHYYLGNIYRKTAKDEKELDTAISEYKKATEIKPDYAEPYMGLGLVYYRRGLNEEAKEAFRKYLELKPEAKEAEEIKRHIDNLRDGGGQLDVQAE